MLSCVVEVKIVLGFVFFNLLALYNKPIITIKKTISPTSQVSFCKYQSFSGWCFRIRLSCCAKIFCAAKTKAFIIKFNFKNDFFFRINLFKKLLSIILVAGKLRGLLLLMLYLFWIKLNFNWLKKLFSFLVKNGKPFFGLSHFCCCFL